MMLAMFHTLTGIGATTKMAISKKGNGRTIAEINQKIKTGDVQVVTAEEMKKLVESSGVEVAYKEVDVVTTGTFGAMCSSGAVTE